MQRIAQFLRRPQIISFLVIIFLFTFQGGNFSFLYCRNLGDVHITWILLGKPEMISISKIENELCSDKGYRGLGILAKKMGNYTKAYRVLKKVQSPHDVISNFFLGELLYQDGNISAAINTWQQIAPHEIAYKLTHSWNFFEKITDDSKNVEIAQVAVKLAPDDPSTHYYLAHVLEDERLYTEAISAYLNGIRTDRESKSKVNALLDLGNTYKKINLMEFAVLSYKQALNIDPDNVDVLLNLSETYIQTKKYSDAKDLLNLLIAKRPTYVPGFVALGDLYKEEGNYKLAREWYNHVLEVNPRSGQGEAALGILELENHNPTKAIEHFKNAIYLQPDIRWWWRWLGISYRRNGDFDKSIYAFYIGINMPGYSSQDLETWIELAKTWDQIGNKQQAIEAWEYILKIDPSNDVAKDALTKLK